MPSVLTAGCGGELGGLEGTFGIDRDHYDDNMWCGWKIEVAASKVR